MARDLLKRVDMLRTPAEVFLFSGENALPYEPQPGLSEAEKWSFVIRFGIDNAGVEFAQRQFPTAAVMAANLALARSFEDQIRQAVPNAAIIEANRNQLADSFNNSWRTPVDLQG